MRKLVFVCNLLFVLNALYATNMADSGYVLPFRIESFTASVESNNKVNLNFTVAETFSVVTHYEILRSDNGIHFDVLGNVTKTSNAPINHYYKFVDNTLQNNANSIVYYRLRQVTNGNGETYSTILVVKLNNKKNDLSIWPMPFSNQINVSFTTEKETEEVMIQLTEMNGKLVQGKKIVFSKGLKTYQFEGLDQLPKGTYVITIKTNIKTIGTKIITKN